ncbi:STAS domain-containing protein [Gordonia sp. ABSL11-1]|uniref:STAS domain-containing protein n=1 Tax=Gordonia sp. ABSL11-1 TaxID=3053924 RepID=UPI002572EC1A|nr:STAS domain-containing protein [Gordonia sp. ABSL11-1]MDL9946530.1 STAS domain-containing protein [Gordonia sp. ABSL11-1]
MTLNAHVSFRSADVSAVARQAGRNLVAGRMYCVQRFTGDIDMQSAADFTAALDRVLAGRPEGVVLDLSGVDFLSASGLAILSRFCTDAESHGIPVAVVGGRTVTRPIEACGLAGTCHVFDTVGEAGAAMAEQVHH